MLPPNKTMKKEEQFNNNPCPTCEGRGYDIVVTSALWEIPVREEKEDCQYCEGTGKINSLALATYKARGGNPVVQRRAY